MFLKVFGIGALVLVFLPILYWCWPLAYGKWRWRYYRKVQRYAWTNESGHCAKCSASFEGSEKNVFMSPREAVVCRRCIRRKYFDDLGMLSFHERVSSPFVYVYVNVAAKQCTKCKKNIRLSQFPTLETRGQCAPCFAESVAMLKKSGVDARLLHEAGLAYLIDEYGNFKE